MKSKKAKKTNKINKIPLNDSYRQYLNYYLGWGAYAKEVYKTDKKSIILNLSFILWSVFWVKGY